MGIKERKQRYKEDFRGRILEAAKKLFVQEGIEATSIRKIAKEIEFSPTTIYLYYKDKSDIVYALHQEGFRILHQRMEPLVHVENPFERLKALGKSYLAFAVEEPDFYEVLFMKKEPMEFLDNNCVEHEWEEGERVFDLLQHTVRECQQIGYFQGMDAGLLSLQAWSSVHGLASLFITGHFQKLGEMSNVAVDLDVLLESTFQVYVAMLEKLR